MQQYNTQTFEYYSLNKDLSNPKRIYCVENGSISFNSLDSLKMSATLNVNISSEEKLNIDMIRIYMVLNGVKSLLGTFLVSIPTSSFEDCIQNMDITCYSTLWPVKVNKTVSRYYIPKGTNAVNEVKRILQNNFTYSFDIIDSQKTTSVDKEYPIGTSYLEIINELLDCIGYTSLYVNHEGEYIAKPYILPQDRGYNFIYNQEDINNILELSCKSELDLFDIPNKFIRYVEDAEHSLVATYTNIYGITGTEATGIVNVNVEQINDASDYDTLYELCKKASAEATSVYHKVEFVTGINPEHLYMDCIQLNHYQCNGKYIETSWEINLETGGSMTHNVREVIIC